MRFLELSQDLVSRAFGKRHAQAKFAGVVAKHVGSSSTRKKFFKKAGKLASRGYKRYFPGASANLRLSGISTVENFIREAERTQMSLLSLREASFNPSSQFPLHPEDRQQNGRNDFGIRRQQSPFDVNRYHNPYQGQNTIPLKQPTSKWKTLLKAGALTGLAVGGGMALTGAARGIAKRSSFVGNIRATADKLSKKDKGFKVNFNPRNLKPVSSSHGGFDASMVSKVRDRLSKRGYGSFAWRGVKAAYQKPMKHLRTISGLNWLNKV